MQEESNQQEKVKSICNMCVTRCGVDVYLEDGRITKVTGMQEHPLNTLCIKAHAMPELVHSSERLTDPLRKEGRRWQKVSWDEAFDLIAHKLSDIQQRHGAKAVAVHVGNPFIATHTEKIVRRFSDLYGTPNYSTGGSFCFLASTIGYVLTCGAHLFPHYSGDNKCMIVWGNNPTETYPIQADAIHGMVGRGAKLLVIDPRATPLAKKADIHSQIRPGTDCALVLGLLNVIIREELYDKAFVEKWTVGFDQLVEHIQDYPPERVEGITWVPAENIKGMARMYAKSKPASISTGIAMDHCTNGIQALRAISILIAVTGNIDVPGGNIYNPALWQSNIRVKERIPDLGSSIGSKYPLFTKIAIESTASPLADAILTEKPYPIKALLVVGCNPVVTFPNTNKVKRAFEKLEFLVVVDTFMTDTAKMADVVLPGSTFLERQDLRHYRQEGIPLVARTNRVVEPIGRSMEDWKIWARLGKRMGYGEYFPWKDTDELHEYLLRPSGISVDQLRKNPGGVYYMQREYQKYLRDGFNTPSKKVEIYSQQMKDCGYEPLPVFHEPPESPVSRPDLANKYPLILITGVRTIAYLHSEFRNLPTLRRLMPEPLIEINPETAASLSIGEGDLVTVESPRGSIKIKSKLTQDINPRVVSVPHGWADESEANVNYLTDDEARDPISAYPNLKSLLCRVTKAR
jgi:anaerobic selenocysteine-containing dehydrogenase